MIGMLLVVALLLLPVPTWAAFTAQEQESIVALKEASQQVSAGLRDYAVGPLLDRVARQLPHRRSPKASDRPSTHSASSMMPTPRC